MSTLPTGVYQRGRSYYVRYRHEGKWKHKSAGSDLSAALELHEKLRSGIEHAPDVVRFNHVVERYRKHLEVYAKPGTLQSNRRVSRHLLRAFGQRPIEALTLIDLERFIEHRLKSVSPSTINLELRILKATLHFGIEQDMYDRMPFKIRMLKQIKRTSSKLFTREEIQRLLECAEPRTRMLLLIAFGTGMRLNELLHLQWQDVDWSERKISVRAKNDWTPKNHQERECFVSKEVIDALKTYRTSQKHHDPRDWVFQNTLSLGQRWSGKTSSYDAIRKAFERAGLYQKGKLTHEIRRAVASTMLLNGPPIHVVKKVLGHSSIKTTELYAFTDEAALRDASKRGIL